MQQVIVRTSSKKTWKLIVRAALAMVVVFLVEITTAGKFGPWSTDDVGKTAVSGDYLFQQADLGVFRGIAGLLSSSGKFSGVLNRIEVRGMTDTPRFTVSSSSHQVQLRTQFYALVNGENGDTFLQKVVATFWKTTVWSAGSVAGSRQNRGGTSDKEWANPRYSAALRTVGASANVWNSQLPR